MSTRAGRSSIGEGAARSGEAPPVRARGLVKRYKEVLAVDHIDLSVHVGDVYGFLGPNGAGKTTTLRMALGLIMPTEGTVELFGRDPIRDGARALEGVAGFVEAPKFYPYLSARKNLELLGALDGGGARERIPEVLDVVELSPRAEHRVGGYSHGMRQRLGIAAALLRRPRLLILDEPATGLDPAGMRDMRALIRRLADQGITVLLSSHQLPEVQELCDRVAIVDSGRVVYEGALADLRRQGGAGYRLRCTDDARALAVLRAQPGIEHATGGGEHGLSFQAQESDVGALSIALGAAGVGILALTPKLATLEDLFFRLTEGNGDGRKPEAGAPNDADTLSGGPLGAAVSGMAASARALEETR
jgi:ABC-2 type transport system ATP-binding protein